MSEQIPCKYPTCKKTFKKSGRRKFCSDACKVAYSRLNLKDDETIVLAKPIKMGEAQPTEGSWAKQQEIIARENILTDIPFLRIPMGHDPKAMTGIIPTSFDAPRIVNSRIDEFDPWRIQEEQYNAMKIDAELGKQLREVAKFMKIDPEDALIFLQSSYKPPEPEKEKKTITPSTYGTKTYKPTEPKEGTMAYFLKHGVMYGKEKSTGAGNRPDKKGSS